tara:strand:- start:4032 stop:4136 length:105 start_codon:yes stop_codon:yes gene_type:complete
MGNHKKLKKKEKPDKKPKRTAKADQKHVNTSKNG